MKFAIKHEIKGRIRIHILQNGMSFEQADRLQYYLDQNPMIDSAKIQERTADAAICYHGGREELLSFLKKFKYEDSDVPATYLQNLLMCDKEAIEVQKILPFLSDTWPLCRIGRAVIRASQSCRQSCNKSQCPACGCRSHHSCTHAPQFSRSFPAREWGSVLQRQGACGQCP